MTSIDWNSNRRELSSGSADAMLKTWDIELGKSVRTIGDLKAEVTRLRYIGTEDDVALVTGDGYFHVYKTDNGRRQAKEKITDDYLYALGLDRAGNRLVVGDAAGGVRQIDRRGKEIRVLVDARR